METFNLDIASAIFKKHHDYYQALGVETIKQQAGQVEQVSADYQGRVIFELLQNAFDKAKKNILVEIHDDCLLIANDGKKFTYQSNYDYEDGDSSRADFQSLCSISTSNKNVNNSIGNKGVGFKSVYSIAKNGFVNLYTKGLVLDDGAEFKTDIAFRIHDSFKNVDSLPSDVPDILRDVIRTKIKKTQKERPDRGVPGYYFPIQIKDIAAQINELFDRGFVTVVEVPFTNYKQQILPLIEEIQFIHFYFVGIKYPGLTVEFDCFEHTFKRQTEANFNSGFVAAALNQNIINAAKAAGLQIDSQYVAVHFRPINDLSQGLLYNYLPTKYPSPFRLVDFHADFHTTVDRKSINFDGPIGQYNRALFRACIELFFATLSSVNGLNIHPNLSIYYLDSSAFQSSNSLEFKWRYLELGNSDAESFFESARMVLGIGSGTYTNGAKYFADIAERFFSTPRNISDHNHFFEYSLKLLHFLARRHGDYKSYTSDVRKHFASSLIAADAKIIHTHQGAVSAKSELFYRSKGTAIDIPPIMHVQMIDFKIEDDEFRRALNIKEFSDYEDILKYFKQTTYSGEFGKANRITEDEQKAILQSLYSLFKSRRYAFNFASSAHRYVRILPSSDRLQSSTTGAHGYFNVSTLFLKTVSGRYKPAQLCKKEELDPSFLNIPNRDDLEPFLRFLGVSVGSNYLFVDQRIYAALKKGLTYIPAPIRFDKNESLSAEVIRSIAVITPGGDVVHPSVINENYGFLSSVFAPAIRGELDSLIVKRYENFPPEYCKILFEHLKRCPLGVEILYFRLFLQFYNYIHKVLVRRQNAYRWADASDVYYAASSRDDYEKLARCNADILCYSDRYKLHEKLNDRIVNLTEGAVEGENIRDNTRSWKERLSQRMVYAFAAVTRSRHSQVNLLDDKSRITQIVQEFANVKFYDANKLTRHITCDKDGITFENEYDYIVDERKLYFSTNCTSSRQAEALSKYFFGNASVTSELEIIFFLKSIEQLQTEFPAGEIDLYKQRWESRYEEKLMEFTGKVLKGFAKVPKPFDKQWNVYNSIHHSKTLINVFKQGKIELLERKIELFKGEFNGLFDEFALKIDTDDSDGKISRMLALIESSGNSQAQQYMEELKGYYFGLGYEDRLSMIETELGNLIGYQPNTSAPSSSDKTPNVEGSGVNRKVNGIFERLQQLKEYNTTDFQAGTGSTVNSLVSRKKLIFQGSSREQSGYYETIGASGEEEVLGYYIQEFLKLSKDDRKNAISKISSFMGALLSNSKRYKEFCDLCLKAIESDDVLTKHLISVFYVSLNWKFSFFDLIVWVDGRPVMVEVKTTRSRNNDAFIISLSEIEEARESDNYEIVRVSTDEIIFMGNPIKKVKDQLTYVQGSNFKIVPRSYKFEFSRDK